jgi:hypothetical protein
MCATQAHRIATGTSDSTDPSHIVEICQFLSTLLALQGVSAVSEEDLKVLLPKLRQWNRTYQKQQITRCLRQLEGDRSVTRFVAKQSCNMIHTRETTAMAHGLKEHCERSLNECGFESCEETGTAKLFQCARYVCIHIFLSAIAHPVSLSQVQNSCLCKY